MRVESRPAVAADIQAFFGKSVPHSIRARVVEMDGDVVGIAGYYLAGKTAMMFSDMKPGIPKSVIWRESKAMMRDMKLPAFCVGSDQSAAFLQRLGWVYAGPSPDGEVFTWQP